MNPNLEKEMQEYYERKNSVVYNPVLEGLAIVGFFLLVLVYFKLPYSWTWQLKLFAIVAPLVTVYYLVKLIFKSSK